MGRKPPQERKTPIDIEHDHYEKIRVQGNDEGLSISRKVDSRFRGFHLDGPEGVRQLRDICDAWLEANEE